MVLPILKQLDYTRVQSPSSINTFRQCPRKYYYNYIAKLPSQPSIHLVRGKVAHSALEEFFLLPGEALTENYEFELQLVLKDLFVKHWKTSGKELQSLGMFAYELDRFFKETLAMLDNWCTGFLAKLNDKAADVGVEQAFELLKPITEKRYHSKELGVQGFIDAIHKENGHTVLLDYKTSKKNEISDDYKLQLGIYALLFQLEHGSVPLKVGINFLKHDEQIMEVDEDLLEFAFREIVQIHQHTKSTSIEDYARKPSALCKWSSGQCDFYKDCKPFGA